MEKAVQLVAAIGSNDPHTIVGQLMTKFPYYTLRRDPGVPSKYRHPDYLGAYGECQAIVRFVRNVIKQVGCPGQAETVVVWADPDIEGGNKVLEGPWGAGTGLRNKERPVGGGSWFAVLVDKDPVAEGRTFPMDHIGLNNFEACLRFTHNGRRRYYGGGAGVYNSADEVVKAFYALCWVSFGIRPGTGAPL
jgi:hypothetical protein